MITFSAKSAKNRFGDLLMTAQREPVEITRNGKRVAVVINSDEYDTLAKERIRAILKQSITEVKHGDVYNIDEVFTSLPDESFNEFHDQIQQ